LDPALLEDKPKPKAESVTMAEAESFIGTLDGGFEEPQGYVEASDGVLTDLNGMPCLIHDPTAAMEPSQVPAAQESQIPAAQNAAAAAGLRVRWTARERSRLLIATAISLREATIPTHMSPAHPAGTGTVTPVRGQPVVSYNLVHGILQQAPPSGTGTPGTPAEQVLAGPLPIVEEEFQDCVSE
jgi:hypothetical protein